MTLLLLIIVYHHFLSMYIFSGSRSDYIRPASHFIFVGTVAFVMNFVWSHWLSYSNRSRAFSMFFVFDIVTFITETVKEGTYLMF